jgi:hypothetical protein
MTAPTPHRTLPIRIPIIPGESLDSWLEALARRNGLTVRGLLSVLGQPPPRKQHSLAHDVPAHTLRSIERQAGLTSCRLDQAVLDRFLHLGWARRGGTRYCPHCLAQNDGRWLLAWRMPWVFACADHHLLLNDTCPACGHTPRTSAAATAGRHHPATCPGPTTTRGGFCGTDLRAVHATRLAPDDPLLATQRWINALITAAGPGAAIPPATATNHRRPQTIPAGAGLAAPNKPIPAAAGQPTGHARRGKRHPF